MCAGAKLEAHHDLHRAQALCERGLFQTKDSVVTPLLSRTEFYARQSEQFVKQSFDGSLPAFLAAFTTRKRLSPEEISEIRRMIDACEKE